jgi:tetratricopeptide (TPR) repeat protein
VAISPTAQALFDLARQKEAEGRMAEAETAYWEALVSAPDSPLVWRGWTQVALSTLGMQRAYEKLEAYLKENPQTAWGHTMMASLVLQNGYPVTAREEAERAIAVNPQLAEAWQIKGTASVELQDFQSAIQAYQKAQELQPDSLPTLLGLADALFQNGSPQEALPLLEKAVQLAPEMGATHLQLGVLRMEMARSPEEYAIAQKSLEKAQELQRTLPAEGQFRTQLALGQCYAKQQNWKQAKQHLENAERINNSDLTLLYEQMQVYRRLGEMERFTKAQQAHEKVGAYLNKARQLTEQIAARPDDLQARLQLARLHAKNNAITEAIKAYRFLLLKAPEMAEAKSEYESLVQKYAP